MTVNANTLLNRFTAKAKFRHIQVLIKLAELGSMRRTAVAVNMTQPAISQLVSELERLLETELFFRHARGVEPTQAAQDLLPVARRILEAVKDGAETVANHLHELDGIVRVSASPAALGGLIYGNLSEFAESHPGVQVHFNQIGSADPLTDIAENIADLICVREPTVVPKDWTFEHCRDDSLTVICGQEHPLSNQSDIASEILGDYKWLLNRVGSVARNRFEEVSEKYGWPLSSRCHIVMHIPELTREMLSTGKYLAIIPRSVALPWLAAGDIVELHTELYAPLPPLGLLRKKESAGTATLALASHLKSNSRAGKQTAY